MTPSGSSTQADLRRVTNSPPVIVEGSRSAADDDEMEIVEAGETVVYSTSQNTGMCCFLGANLLEFMTLNYILDGDNFVMSQSVCLCVCYVCVCMHLCMHL